MAIAFLPLSAPQAGEKLGAKINGPNLLLLLTANELCEPAVADPEVLETELRRADEATPVDVRGFMLGQQQMMVDQAKVEPPLYTQNICDAARDVALRLGLTSLASTNAP